MGRPVTAICWLVLLHASLGCNRTDRQAAEAKPERPCVTIPGAPLCWRLPERWLAQAEPPPPLKEPTSASQVGATIDGGATSSPAELQLDRTEKLATATRREGGQPLRIAPRLEVYRDPQLREGTSATDYLVANRVAQKRSLGEVGIRHLEVEPIRRDERRGFHLRDAFDVPLPGGGQAPVSQQALLLVDGRTGYVIAATHLEDDRALLADELREILASVSFLPPAAKPR